MKRKDKKQVGEIIKRIENMERKYYRKEKTKSRKNETKKNSIRSHQKSKKKRHEKYLGQK